MPMFRITVEKFSSIHGEHWTNVYWATGATVGDFTSEVNAIVAAERPLLFSYVTITKVRVDDATQGTDNYRTYIINQVGTRAGAVGEGFPLWHTGRVDFETATGRPSRKYLRGGMAEGDSDGVKLSSGFVALLQTYADAIVATAAIVDVDGQDFVRGAPYPNPQMRQLRRGSKKKVTPLSPGTTV